LKNITKLVTPSVENGAVEPQDSDPLIPELTMDTILVGFLYLPILKLIFL
jgi:hypothetical protein